MSVDAVAYVLKLTECPDGAELDPSQKCILFCLADHHNRSTRRCEPGVELLILESLQSRASVYRQMEYLERHCVIERRKPHGAGRDKYVNYVFLFLDDADRLAEKLKALREGSQAETLFSPQGKVSEGSQSTGRRVSEGSQIDPRNKEESVIKGNRKSKPTATAAKAGGTPVWNKLHPNLQEKTLAQLRLLADASVGDGWAFGEHTPQEQAAYMSERMHTACLRAEVWPHVATQIRDEWYAYTLHNELAKVDQRLEDHGYSDEQHA